MRMIAAGKFKATCLAVMDDIQSKRESVVVTKNGKPIVKMVPLAMEDGDPIFGFYRGKLDTMGDVISPMFSDEELEKFFERSAGQMKCS